METSRQKGSVCVEKTNLKAFLQQQVNKFLSCGTFILMLITTLYTYIYGYFVLCALLLNFYSICV